MSDNINDTIHALNNAFEEFKTTNDTRLQAVESKGVADTLTNEKLERIQAEVVDLQKKAARPSLNGVADQNETEHKSAFGKWARKGAGEYELEAIEKKAITLNDGTNNANANGGFLLPKVIEAGIRESLRTLSPIRSRATVITVSTDDYGYTRNLRGLQTGWVGETDARPETNTPTLAQIKVPMGELYANPAVSQRALDDAAFNLEEWMERNIAEEMAIEENNKFVTGDGVNKPKGILATTGMTTIKTGAASAMPANGDFVAQMVYSMKAAYRNEACFLAQGGTIAGVMNLQDKNGNYLWRPSLAVGQPSALGGYEVLEVEDMDAIGAGKSPLIFANLKQGYLIADRIGIRTLRDPYTHKPFVHFYATKRVGGHVQDTDAFVVLKVAA